MVILKGSVQLPHNLLLRESAHDTVITRNVLPIQEIKTDKKYIKIRRIISITKTPGDNDRCRYNPDLLSGIYMTSVMEYQLCIVAENWSITMR